MGSNIEKTSINQELGANFLCNMFLNGRNFESENSDIFSSELEKFSASNSQNDSASKEVEARLTNEKNTNENNLKTQNSEKTRKDRKTNKNKESDVKKAKNKKDDDVQNEKISDDKIEDNKIEDEKINNDSFEDKVDETQNEEIEANTIENEDIEDSDDIETQVENIMEALKATNLFSNEELTTIQNALTNTLQSIQKEGGNFQDFLTNFKENVGDDIFATLENNNLLQNFEVVVNEAIEGKFDLKDFELTNDDIENIDISSANLENENKEFDVTNEITSEDISENIQNDTLNLDTADEELSASQNELVSIFEEVLNDVFEEGNLGNSDNEMSSLDFQKLTDYKNNIMGNSSFSQNFQDSEFSSSQNKNYENLYNMLSGKENTASSIDATVENSSMLEVKNNFNNVQDFLNNIYENNVNNTSLADATKETLQSEAKIYSSSILKRVEETLKEVVKSKDGSTISLRLDPPSLGEVKVDVTMKDGTLFARLQAESKDVEMLLKDKSSELYQILKDSGVDAQNVNVFISSKDSNENSDAQNKQNQNSKNTLHVLKDEELNLETEENELQDESQNASYSSKWIA